VVDVRVLEQLTFASSSVLRSAERGPLPAGEQGTKL